MAGITSERPQSTQEILFSTTYYILLHQHCIPLHKHCIGVLCYMENSTKNKNPTIHSIVITHYYILTLINGSYSLGHELHDANPYYGLVSPP